MIVSDIAYAATAEFTNDVLPRFGIEVTKVNLSDLAAVQGALRPETRLIYAETPCNPLLRLTDLAAVARIAHEAGAKLAVDSTFATPLATRPLALGADFVIHSLSKYLCGHGDAIGGAILGPADILADLRKKVAIRTGGILSPFNAWLILRGLATLPLRMRAHQEGALAVAKFLEGHAKVRRVIYPGLPSHPQHELAKRQMGGRFGGMISFELATDLAGTVRFLEACDLITLGESLGGVESLIEHPAIMTHASVPAEIRRQIGIGDSLVRLSVGVEDVADLRADLESALRRI